eukprot:5298861-Alexandrium_andersonii.AAC.1
MPTTWARTAGAQLNPSTQGGQETNPGDSSTRASSTFHVETRLPSGNPALLLDIGSVGNLAGEER